jgi:hypothetical protein
MAIVPPPAPGARPPQRKDDFVTRKGPMILLAIGVAFALVSVIMMASEHPIVGGTLSMTAVVTVLLAILVDRIESLSWRGRKASLRKDRDDDR